MTVLVLTHCEQVGFGPLGLPLRGPGRGQGAPPLRRQVVPHRLEKQLLAVAVVPDQPLVVHPRHQELPVHQRQPHVFHQLKPTRDRTRRVTRRELPSRRTASWRLGRASPS